MSETIRFNPYHLRQLGLSSTQEAKILWYLRRHGPTERKALGRVFDLRLVERLAQIGLVVCRNGRVEITAAGLETLQRCIGGDGA